MNLQVFKREIERIHQFHHGYHTEADQSWMQWFPLYDLDNHGKIIAYSLSEECFVPERRWISNGSGRHTHSRCYHRLYYSLS